MAIFVFFAWMIEAANALGLIEIEAQDPASRAYRLAHEGLAEMKTQLLGAPIELLGEHKVRIRRPEQPPVVLESLPDGTVTMRFPDGRSEALLELGAGGGVDFIRDEQAGLEIRIQACTEDGGSYEMRMVVPPLRRKSGSG